MKLHYPYLLFVGMFGLIAAVAQQANYLQHEVKPKETLYAISKQYNVSIDELNTLNPVLKEGLKVGQIINIKPLTSSSQPNLNGAKTHIVQPKETLFGISKAYAVSTEQLIAWNNIQNNQISIGQTLIVSEPQATQQTISSKQEAPTTKETFPQKSQTHIVQAKETAYSISKEYEISIDQLKEWNKLEGLDLQIGQELIVSNGMKAVAEPVNQATNSNPTESSKSDSAVATNEVTKPIIHESGDGSFDKIVENGLCERIKGSDNTKKFLALHRSAPIGTILQVKNEMNDLLVFVRVIGKLPNTGDNNKLVLKISEAAYDRLGAIDDRFPIEISYVL